jgi:Uma2 family endonuclease
MPHIKKAELIEGGVYVLSPVSASHSQSPADVMGWLAAYRAATPGIGLYDNATVRLDPDNEVQPAAVLRLEPAVGGHSKISDDNYVKGPPELIVEIAASSAAVDLHDKLKVYRRNGVQEYLVWPVYDERVDWYRLDAERGEYVPLTPEVTGVICSQVFPGLRLAAEALLDGDLAGVLAELQKGLATPEHAAFVERLAKT